MHFFDSENALSFERSITLSVILTFVVTLVVGVVIGILSILIVNKWRSEIIRQTETETEMRPPPAIYQEPEDVKTDHQIQVNIAFGNIQH